MSKPEASESWVEIVGRVTEASKALLGEAVVAVFGGVTSGNLTAASDVDILLVSKRLPRTARGRAELKEALEKEAGLPPINPVEIHLATPEEAERNPIYREVLRNHAQES